MCPCVCLRQGPRWLPEVEFHSLLFHYSYKATARLQSAELQKRIFPSNFSFFSLTPSSFSSSSVVNADTCSGNKSTISFISLQLYELDCLCWPTALHKVHTFWLFKSFLCNNEKLCTQGNTKGDTLFCTFCHYWHWWKKPSE